MSDFIPLNNRQEYESKAQAYQSESWKDVDVQDEIKIYKGHEYKVISKKEKHLKFFSFERIKAIALTFITLGIMAYFSSSIRESFLGRKIIYFGVKTSEQQKSADIFQNQIIDEQSKERPTTRKQLIVEPKVPTTNGQPIVEELKPKDVSSKKLEEPSFDIRQTKFSELSGVKSLGPLSTKNFSQHAQLVLEQFYKKPLPSEDKVTVPNLKGEMVVWKNLSPQEQKEILEANKKGATSSLFLHYEGPSHCKEIIPRWSHGCMHVSRAAVEVSLIAQIYKKYDPSFKLSEEDILLAQYLTIFHDSARQAEGVDVWDERSADNARVYLTAMGFDEEKINQAIKDLKSKDGDPSTRNPIAKLIHDADCLDIMRIYGKISFKDKYLDMFNDLKNQPGFLKDLQKLKNDLYEFIRFTEQPLLKSNLETQSKNYYQEVVGLVGFKEGGKARFSFISNLLGEQIGQLPQISHQVKFSAKPEGQWGINPYYNPGKGEIGVAKNLLSAGKGGVNQSYIVSDNTGKLFFWKVGDKFTLPSETGASKLSSHITGGLVPIAVKKTFQPENSTSPIEGTMQPYVEMKKGPFAPKETKQNFDPAKLNEKQREQMFVHMIADRIISNYDSHTGQFRIDDQGNVIGFDKGQAYKFFGTKAKQFFGKEEPKTFNPDFYWQPLGTNKPTYSVFAEYLKNHPEEAERIWSSLTVQEALRRCKDLKEEQIQEILQDYANVAFVGKQNEFFQQVYQRAQGIDVELKKYFNLST